MVVNNIRALPLKIKLIIAFLLLGIVPLIISSMFVVNLYTDSMKQQAFNQLISTRNYKSTQLANYFNNLRRQVTFLVTNMSKDNMTTYSAPVLGAISEFNRAIASLSSNPKHALKMLANLYITGSEQTIKPGTTNRGLFDDVHEELHPTFSAFIHNFSYQDMFLINTQGNIVYSVKKEPHLGQNIHGEHLAQSGLSKAFIKASNDAKGSINETKTPIYFSDFSIDPITKINSAFLAIPLYDFSQLGGIIVFQISLDNITRVMREHGGLDLPGETYLIGPDKLLRSTSSENIKANHFNEPEHLIFNTSAINSTLQGKALDGFAESYSGDKVLYASAPITVFSETWAVLTEITTDEAYEKVYLFMFIVLIIVLLSIALIVSFSLLLSNSIAKPIMTLTNISEEMASGNLNITIDIESNDELGRLAKSFNHMRNAIRQKMYEMEQQNKELKRLDQLKSDLLANTTHELKTPLNGIIGLSESLLNHVPNDKKITLQHIMNSGRRLSNLVNDILDAAKLKQNKITINPIPLNLRQMVDLDFSSSKTLIGNKKISLINSINTKMCVLADENRLQQIFQNLVGNAIKFTDQGEIEISATHISNTEISIHVKDTGMGISQNNRNRIFETFEQVDATSKKSASGTGLGLSITRELVELHGGSIDVKSNPQHGSIFSFTLPISNQTAQNSNTIIPNVISATTTNQLVTTKDEGFHIMVVDDEPINIEIVVNQLSQYFSISTAYDGNQAIEQVKEKKPDLILLDVMMPNLCGYETCRLIRQLYSSYELPVIFLTARNQINDLVTAFNAGGNDYLSKPFYRDELFARVQVQLELSIQRNRMSQLRTFANCIAGLKSQEDLIDQIYQLLMSDAYIEKVSIFFNGLPIEGKSHQDLKNQPTDITQPADLSNLSNEDQVFHQKISEFYSLSIKFSHHSSIDWLRNIMLQINTSVQQLQLILNDHSSSLYIKEIKPILEDTLYVKVDRNYCSFFMMAGGQIKEVLFRITFKQLMMNVDNNEIIQINKSIAINPTKAIRINKDERSILLKGEQVLPIAKRYYFQTKQQLAAV